MQIHEIITDLANKVRKLCLVCHVEYKKLKTVEHTYSKCFSPHFLSSKRAQDLADSFRGDVHDFKVHTSSICACPGSCVKS